MAKSGCLMDLKSSLIRELHKVNMTDEQFSEMQQTVNSSVYEMYMNTKIEKIEKDVSELYTSDFINHSGGALGADITFDEIGNEYGFKHHKHYYHGVRNENNAPHGNEKIDSLSYGQGKVKAALAAKRNWGYQNSTVSDPRLIRNWSQVKNSSTVFAISTIVGKGQKIFPDQKSDTRIAVAPSVTGGTGYAVGMAINEDKKIYVFNQKSLDKDYPAGWYVYDKATDNFIPTETPVLTENYAGIGSRNLTEEGTQAIKDLFENTLSKSKSNGTVSTLEPEINIYSTDKNGFETLSNLSPREFTFNGKQYHSVEHAYQTLKTGKFNESVFNEYNNRYASGMQLGKFTGGTKADIDTSYQLMKDLIKSSIEQNEDAKKLLLSTKNSSLTHSQEKGSWGKDLPKILMEVRSELKNYKASGSGPKEWISGNNESEFYVFERESVADFINVIETNTGDLTARTDNAGYHSLISGLMGLIQNTLKDAELTKTIDVALIKTKDAYSNARFIRGEENFYGEDPNTGEKILETGDRLEVRYGTDVDMDRLVEEGPKKGTIVDDYSNGLQGFRELMVHDMLHGIVDDAMHMNRELYNKAASIQSQYSKYVTVDAMIKAMKDRSGFDATAAQIEQIKDIVNYINGSPVEFMMYALTNPMVYEIMDSAGKTESAKYDLIDTSGRAIRDKRFQKSKFRDLMDKFVDIINNTYKQIKIGMKMSGGKVAEKNGIDVLKDTIMMAAVKNLEGTGLNKEQRERKLSDAQYGDYNLGGALDLSDKYKEYNERIKKFNDKIFSKTIDTGDRFKVGERVEAFGSWMNKFSLIKDNREKGRFRLFSDVINTIVEDTTSRSNGAADFYKIFREIKGSRDRDKIEMIQTAREMLDKNWIDVSKEERESMSYFMQTDWKSLGLDLDSYSELLSDNAKLDSEIGRLKSDIGVTEYNENAKFLGYYMVNGVSKAPELMRNANMIVNRVYGSGTRNPLVKQSDVNLTISKVDKLATMYAMKYLSQNDKDNIVKTIKSQRDLVQATSNLYYSYSDEQTKKFAQVGLDKYIMKGYVKKSSVVDMKFEIVESSKVRKNKYVAHTDIRIDNSIGKILKDGKTYHLVVSRDYDTARTQGGFDDIHIIDKQIGIRDIYSGSDKEMIGRIINSNDMFKAIHKDKTKGTSYKLSTATSDDMNDLAMMEDQLIPSYDVSGNVIDYEIPISSDIRKKYGREINDIANTVAQTISHINSKDNAIGNNRKFAEMLISESDSNEGKPGYVLLRPTSQEERDKGIRHKYDEEWAMIPKYIQDAILSKDEYGDNIRDGLWVKEGRINNIIGYKDPSIANLKLFGKDLTDYPNMQRAVQVMESYWKALSSRYKEIVVKYFPNVVWANITSNMWVAMRHGVGPLEYAKSFIRHWSSLTDYLETVDEINMLKLEDKSGTSKNKNRIEALEEKLVRNPFNLLIKDGQFSTIMEDLDMSGMTKKTHIQDYIDTTAERFDNVGIESKEFIANIYATRGSAANRTLEKLTVFNDIINRSIIMERMMQDLEKIKFNNEDDKTQKIQDILNYVDMLFVNYSYLDNKYLKYANDTNILQFTKYFFRALKANISMMSRNPLSTIGFESFDEFAFDLSDSFDQYASPITGLSNRFIPNPVQMFQDVVTPHTAAVLFH